MRFVSNEGMWIHFSLTSEGMWIHFSLTSLFYSFFLLFPMDSTGFEDPQKPVTEEAAIAGAASLETMHHDNSPLVTTGDTDEATSDGTSSIIQALYLVQVIYLVFAGIIALLFALFNIVVFAVLVVGFFGYFGLFWYNIASSGRTRENESALAIRSFSVAAVLGAFSLSATNNLVNLPHPQSPL